MPTLRTILQGPSAQRLGQQQKITRSATMARWMLKSQLMLLLATTVQVSATSLGLPLLSPKIEPKTALLALVAARFSLALFLTGVATFQLACRMASPRACRPYSYSDSTTMSVATVRPFHMPLQRWN